MTVNGILGSAFIIAPGLNFPSSPIPASLAGLDHGLDVRVRLRLDPLLRRSMMARDRTPILVRVLAPIVESPDTSALVEHEHFHADVLVFADAQLPACASGTWPAHATLRTVIDINLPTSSG